MTDEQTAHIIASLDRLETGQMTLQADVAGLKTDVGGLKTDVTGLKGDVTGLRAGQDAIRADVSKLSGDLDRVRVDLMERMDRLQDQLTLQQANTDVSLLSGDRAERIAKAASDETRLLGEQVSVMVRQIQRLQTDMRQLRGGA